MWRPFYFLYGSTKETTRETGHMYNIYIYIYLFCIYIYIFFCNEPRPVDQHMRRPPDPHSNAYPRRAHRYCTVYSLISAASGTRSNLPFFFWTEQHGRRPSFRRYRANHTVFSMDMNSWIPSTTYKHLLRREVAPVLQPFTM